MQELYTLNELSNILKVTVRTLYTYIDEGKLDAFKIGKEWRVTEESLKDFLNSRKSK